MPPGEEPKPDEFPHHLVIPTRWQDNDVYGHVNNVVYYSWFDTAVNALLIERGVLDTASGGGRSGAAPAGNGEWRTLGAHH